MDYFKTALELLPAKLSLAAKEFSDYAVEEIRLRQERCPSLLIEGNEQIFCVQPVTAAQLRLIMEKATDASIHSSLAQLSEGYVSYKGLRIGVCGLAVEKQGQLKGLGDFTSVCIRIPYDFKWDCSEVYMAVSKPFFKSTLIISPPGGGKTSLLREFIRRLSDSGVRVGLVDERLELSCPDVDGRYGFDVGRCCDVITGVNKSAAAMMLIRAMNPQVLAVDEITKSADIDALLEAAGCGVEILATAHSVSAERLLERPLYRKLLDEKIFSNAIEIYSDRGKRKYKWVSLCS